VSYYYSLSELENYSDKNRFVFNPFSILDRFYSLLCITWHSYFSLSYMIMGQNSWLAKATLLGGFDYDVATYSVIALN